MFGNGHTWRYDQVNNSWRQMTSMPGPARFYPTSFVVGKIAYVGLGADATNGDHSDFYAYDAGADRWSATVASFRGGAREAAMSFSVGAYGYVCAGRHVGTGITYYNDLWRYDHVGNTWTRMRNLPASGRADGVGLSGSSFGYVGLGYNYSYFGDFWQYDPVANVWTGLPWMATAREAVGSFLLGNSLYVGGGMSSGAAGSYPLRDFWTLHL